MFDFVQGKSGKSKKLLGRFNSKESSEEEVAKGMKGD
jgi:hypothetical protein